MTGRRFFLLFFLCALVPFAAAKLSLSYGWFDKGATNKGQWLEQEVTLIPALATGDMHWSIAYVTTQHCAQDCLAAATLLQQLYIGLGRKQLGAQALLITTVQIDAIALQQQFPVLKPVVVTPVANIPLLPGHTISVAQLESLDNQFVIINQQGLVLLRYPLANQIPAQLAADMRSDLLRLLNYDRSRL